MLVKRRETMWDLEKEEISIWIEKESKTKKKMLIYMRKRMIWIIGS